MVIKHNKSKYIRKYDYLRSFYLPQDEWFISTNTLSSAIDQLVKQHNQNLDIDDEEDSNEEREYDTYSFYKETKDEGGLEQEDPRIIEGNKVDVEARKFIKDYFKLESHDFSNDSNLTSFEKAFEETKKYLNKENIILFQPTFIYDGLITKPDALVIKDKKAILIEVKGTSNPKVIHTFDLYFQFNVINPTIKLDKCYLCLIKYEPLKRYGLSFALNERGSFSKNGFSMSSKWKCANPFDLNIIKLKENLRQANDLESVYSNPVLNFINLFTNNEIDDEFIKAIKKTNVPGFYFCSSDLKKEAFDKRIKTLKEYTPNDMTFPQFKPVKQYKSVLKDYDNWKKVRELWFNSNKFYATQFSGNLIKYHLGLLLNDNQYQSLDDFISKVEDLISNDGSKPDNKLKKYRNFLLGQADGIKQITKDNKVIVAYKPELIKNYMLKNLQGKKKVYFDFESINTAVRVVDDTLPFMQAVNQVSVCYDEGNGQLNQSPSLVIDPLNGLTINDYKQIIDRILPPTSNITLEQKYDYWKQFKYIVYNKNFECTRLNEMIHLINEDEYTTKATIITDNIVDLAELFIINQKRDDVIVFKELKGFYSIKKVLPLVMKYDRQAFDKAKCKDYHTLDVQNGVKAQSLSTRRFFKQIKDDDEWNNYVEQLKIYCDNDVRAMAAVEYFVDDLLNERIKF